MILGISSPWPCLGGKNKRGLFRGKVLLKRPETRGAVILIWCVKTPVLFLLPSSKLSSSLRIGIPKKKTHWTSTQTCLAIRDAQQVGMHKRGKHILFWPAPCLRFSSSCVCNSFCYMSSPLRPDWTDRDVWFQKVSVKCFRSAFHGLTNCQVYRVWKWIGRALNCDDNSKLHMDTFLPIHFGNVNPAFDEAVRFAIQVYRF